MGMGGGGGAGRATGSGTRVSIAGGAGRATGSDTLVSFAGGAGVATVFCFLWLVSFGFSRSVKIFRFLVFPTFSFSVGTTVASSSFSSLSLTQTTSFSLSNIRTSLLPSTSNPFTSNVISPFLIAGRSCFFRSRKSSLHMNLLRSSIDPITLPPDAAWGSGNHILSVGRGDTVVKRILRIGADASI